LLRTLVHLHNDNSQIMFVKHAWILLHLCIFTCFMYSWSRRMMPEWRKHSKLF
jgi:hypothetical protein